MISALRSFEREGQTEKELYPKESDQRLTWCVFPSFDVSTAVRTFWIVRSIRRWVFSTAFFLLSPISDLIQSLEMNADGTCVFASLTCRFDVGVKPRFV